MLTLSTLLLHMRTTELRSGEVREIHSCGDGWSVQGHSSIDDFVDKWDYALGEVHPDRDGRYLGWVHEDGAVLVEVPPS